MGIPREHPSHQQEGPITSFKVNSRDHMPPSQRGCRLRKTDTGRGQIGRSRVRDAAWCVIFPTPVRCLHPTRPSPSGSASTAAPAPCSLPPPPSPSRYATERPRPSAMGAGGARVLQCHQRTGSFGMPKPTTAPKQHHQQQKRDRIARRTQEKKKQKTRRKECLERRHNMSMLRHRKSERTLSREGEAGGRGVRVP